MSETSPVNCERSSPSIQAESHSPFVGSLTAGSSSFRGRPPRAAPLPGRRRLFGRVWEPPRWRVRRAGRTCRCGGTRQGTAGTPGRDDHVAQRSFKRRGLHLPCWPLRLRHVSVSSVLRSNVPRDTILSRPPIVCQPQTRGGIDICLRICLVTWYPAVGYGEKESPAGRRSTLFRGARPRRWQGRWETALERPHRGRESRSRPAHGGRSRGEETREVDRANLV